MAVQVEQYRDLDAVAAAAAGVLDRAAQPVLFDRLDWFRLTRRFIDQAPLLALSARDGGCSAWLFLSVTNGRAEPLGSWYTLAFAPIFAGAPSNDVKAALLTAMLRRLRASCHWVTLRPLQAGVGMLIEAAFVQAGWCPRVGAVTASWTVDTSEQDWTAYWAARPSRLRNTVERRRRRDPLAVRVWRVFDAAAWQAYEAVFAASWKPSEGSMPFLRALAEQEGAAGTLRLGIGRLGDRPVAAQLWLVENGVATIHKLAHVAAEDARSPGTQLTAAMFEHVLTHDRPRLIDFGTGDDPYKRDWMDRRQPLLAIEAVDPRRLRGVARLLRWQAARLVRARRGR